MQSLKAYLDVPRTLRHPPFLISPLKGRYPQLNGGCERDRGARSNFLLEPDHRLLSIDQSRMEERLAYRCETY